MLSCRWMEEKVHSFLLCTLAGRAAFQVTHTAEEHLSDLCRESHRDALPPCQPAPGHRLVWRVRALV